MQFSVIRTYCATRFRDTNNVVVADADWKNYVNTAYHDVLAHCTFFPWSETSSVVQIAANTRGVALPLDVWQIEAAWDQDNQFPLVALEGRQQVYMEYPQQTEVGQAMHYHVFNNQFNVYPMPAQLTNYKLEYIQRPADLNADADLPVFPVQYHDMLVDGAVALAYVDDGNLQQAQVYQTRFEQRRQQLVNDLMQPRQDRYYEIVDTHF